MNRKAIEAMKREVDWESDNDQTPAFSCGWNAAIDAALALEDEPLAGAGLTYAVSKKSDGDYPEDFPHENGDYFRVCTDCDNHFTGHKRRLICKVCAQPTGDARKALDAYKPGEWFHVHTIDEMQEFYNFRLPFIREAAEKCGYAIGVHGSERRDLDLMAMPWRENPSSLDELAIAVQMAACGFEAHDLKWTEKPCGRKAISLHACWCEWYDMISAGHIDLSVVGALTPPPKIEGLTRTFWVCEQIGENGNCLALYWDGGSSRSFTPDIEKAIQFCRKDDAFWVTRGWHWKDTKLTEHVILEAARQRQAVESGE